VDEELKTLEPDPRWSDWLEKAHEPRLEAHPEPVTDGETMPAPGFAEWAQTNVYAQRQEGFVSASVNLPLGDITARQTRVLADIVRRYTRDSLRTTVEQNF